MFTNTLLLIDTSALAHRAFHALPPLTTPDGKPIGAIYGFIKLLLKNIETYQPTHIAAALDLPGKTFRDKLFDDYKSHRPPTAEALTEQLEQLPEVLSWFSIPSFSCEDYEADDVIGTLAVKFKSDASLRIIILTGDLDTLQLVEGDQVVVATPQKGTVDALIYNEEEVKKRYNLSPRQFADYKALVGDASDNIPGVKGIGPKTATTLLTRYTTLEHAFQSQEKEDVILQKILPHKEQITIAKKLSTIITNIPLIINLPDLVYRPTSAETLIPHFEQCGFKSLVTTFQKKIEKEHTPRQISLT